MLEKKAFAGCYRLKEIVLPNTEHVCKIEQQVFDDCCNIWGTSYGIHHPSEEDEGRIFVADNLLEDYLNDPGWEGIGHCIRPISEQLGDAEEDVQSEKIEHFEGEELLESEGASPE